MLTADNVSTFAATPKGFAPLITVIRPIGSLTSAGLGLMSWLELIFETLWTQGRPVNVLVRVPNVTQLKCTVPKRTAKHVWCGNSCKVRLWKRYKLVRHCNGDYWLLLDMLSELTFQPRLTYPNCLRYQEQFDHP